MTCPCFPKQRGVDREEGQERRKPKLAEQSLFRLMGSTQEERVPFNRDTRQAENIISEQMKDASHFFKQLPTPLRPVCPKSR